MKALHQGYNLRYAAWETDAIWKRYGDSIIVTHADSYLSLYVNHRIRLSMYDMIDHMCLRISYRM